MRIIGQSSVAPTLLCRIELLLQPSASEPLLEVFCLRRQILSIWLDGRLSSGPNSKWSRRKEQDAADAEMWLWLHHGKQNGIARA